MMSTQETATAAMNLVKAYYDWLEQDEQDSDAARGTGISSVMRQRTPEAEAGLQLLTKGAAGSFDYAESMVIEFEDNVTGGFFWHKVGNLLAAITVRGIAG